MKRNLIRYALASLMIGVTMTCMVLGFMAAHDGTLDTSGIKPGTFTYGPNGLTETRCIDGYRFVIGERGNIQQVLDGQGHGVKCGGGDGN